MSREYRVLLALRGQGVPAPMVFHLHERTSAPPGDDPTGVGTDFYLMEFVDGDVFDDPGLPTVALNYLFFLKQAARCALLP